jgi:uncharacterized secreted protein with C-terminal beta-propeller domain
MKKYIIFLNALVLLIFSSFINLQQKATDDFKYVKEVNGIRIYYSVKSYSPKPGKAAKKVVFKLKNATKTSKTLSFITKTTDESGSVKSAEVTLCLKPNEENLKQEVSTEFKEVKSVEVSGDKTTEGGC